ncbi:MAG: hypothetical protein WC292_05080 [Clostridia bacterium]
MDAIDILRCLARYAAREIYAVRVKLNEQLNNFILYAEGEDGEDVFVVTIEKKLA